MSIARITYSHWMLFTNNMVTIGIFKVEFNCVQTISHVTVKKDRNERSGDKDNNL